MSEPSSLKSVLQISLSQADTILNWANVFVVLSLITTLVATVVLIWVTGVRERYSDERIAANEFLTAQAKTEAAEARERTAHIEGENLKLQSRLEAERSARLLLEARISPRRLTSEQKDSLVEDLTPYRGQRVKVFSPHNTEGNEYAIDFISVFKRSGWEVADTGTSTGVAFIEYDVDPRGIQLAVAPNAPAVVLASVQALTLALAKEKLRSPEPIGTPIDTTEGWIEFGVGVKPPQSED